MTDTITCKFSSKTQYNKERGKRKRPAYNVGVLLAGVVCCSTAYSYIPDHVNQFEKTGSCINCDLSGIAFLSTNSSGKFILDGANLLKSSITSSGNFSHQYSSFRNIFGFGSDISYMDLSYSNFSGSNLSKSALVDDNLTGTDFSNANLSGVNFTKSILYKANISKEQLKSVGSLCGTILPNGSEHDC